MPFHSSSTTGQTATPAPAGRRELKKLETRRALHRAALTLALEHGWSRVTTDDIAGAAGVSPRTFFNYFPTKEASLAGAPEEIVEKVSQACAERPTDESPWQTSRLVAEGLLTIATRDEELRRARLTLLAEQPEAASLMQGSLRAVETGLAESLVARAETSPNPTTPWRARMMALVSLDAVWVANQLAADAREARELLLEILDAHDPVYA